MKLTTFFSYALIAAILPCNVAEAAKVFVSSDPKSATIFIDGKDSGKKTPAIMELAVGQVNIALKLSGHKDWSSPFTVKKGPLQKIKGTLKKTAAPKAKDYTLSIMVLEPEECFIYVNSKQLVKLDGKPYLTPVEIPKFPPGKYRVTISKRGYRDLSIKDYVLDGNAKSIGGTLQRGRSMLIGRKIPTVTVALLKQPASTTTPSTTNKTPKRIQIDEAEVDSRNNNPIEVKYRKKRIWLRRGQIVIIMPDLDAKWRTHPTRAWCNYRGHADRNLRMRFSIGTQEGDIEHGKEIKVEVGGVLKLFHTDRGCRDNDGVIKVKTYLSNQ